MTAEDTAICMKFIKDDELQILEQSGPFRMVGQDAFVEHVGIAENNMPTRAN